MIKLNEINRTNFLDHLDELVDYSITPERLQRFDDVLNTRLKSLTVVFDEFKDFQNIKIVGLMGMATFTDNKEQLQKEFGTLKQLSDNLSTNKTDNCNLKTLSMGMSNDYPIAVKNGSTMVRVGSSIFGKRNYNI